VKEDSGCSWIFFCNRSEQQPRYLTYLKIHV